MGYINRMDTIKLTWYHRIKTGLLSGCFYLIASVTFGQNAVAELHFESAEKAFNEGNYATVINKLNETEDLIGMTSKTLFLRIITQDAMMGLAEDHEDIGQILSTLRSHIQTYLDVMGERGIDERYRVVYSLQEKYNSFLFYEGTWPPRYADDYKGNDFLIMPGPANGKEAFKTWLNEQLAFSVLAEEGEIKGKILLSLFVDKDGSFLDIQIQKDLGYGVGAKIRELLLNGPKWKPGIVAGRPQKIALSLPLFIDLSNN